MWLDDVNDTALLLICARYFTKIISGKAPKTKAINLGQSSRASKTGVAQPSIKDPCHTCC